MQEVKECVDGDIGKGARKQRVWQEREHSCLSRVRGAARVFQCRFASGLF